MSEVRRGASGALRLALGLGLGIAAALGAPLVAAQDQPPSAPSETSQPPPVEPAPPDAAQPPEPEPAPSEPALPEPVAPGPLVSPPSEPAPLDTSQPAPVEPAPVDAGPAPEAPAPEPSPTPAEPEPAPQPTPAGPIVPDAGAGLKPASTPEAPLAPVRPPVEEAPTAWTFSLVTGYYNPRLGTLNHILKDTSVTIMQDPNFLLPRNQNFPFEKRNLPVDGISGGPTYGVDAFYSAGGPHSFGLSFSSWRGETIGRDMISLFLISNLPPIQVPRSARYNLVLDRVFLEWRYHLRRTAEGRGVYLNVGLAGVTMAFLTMDTLVNVVHPARNFASVSSDESFGWGYTTRFGVGGDYPLTSWLSVGGQANYVVATITKMQVTRHFSAGFPLTPIPNPFSIRPGVPLPQPFFDPLEGRDVKYATITTTGEIQEEAGPTKDLALELSGLEAMIKLTIHF
jgi:hypothetical protein